MADQYGDVRAIRIPSFSPQPIVQDTNNETLDASYLVPHYHLHLMPNQAVVYPPNDREYWDIPGAAESYAKAKQYGHHTSPYTKYPVKTALPAVQYANDVGRDIYLFSDGSRTGDEVYKKVLEKNHETYGKHHDSVRTFMRHMIAERHLSLSQAPSSQSYTTTGSEEYFVPVHMSLEVTSQCNARCKHCYGAFGNIRDDVMPLESVLALLEVLRKQGVRGIELTGGECTMHPDFSRILEECLKLFGLVAVLTNGISIDPDVFDVADKYSSNLMVQICINGKQDYHDEFVAFPGAFDLSSSSIRKFAERGVHVRVPMNLTSKNMKDIEFVLDHARECGASQFSVAWVDTTVGRAKHLESDISCKERRLAELTAYAVAEKLEKDFPDFVIFSVPKTTLRMMEYDKSCGAGRRAFYVTADGFFHICPMSIGTDIPGYGTISSFADESSSLDTPLLRKLSHVPAPNSDDCGGCKYEFSCKGCLTRGIRRFLETETSCSWGVKHQMHTVLQDADWTRCSRKTLIKFKA